MKFEIMRINCSYIIIYKGNNQIPLYKKTIKIIFYLYFIFIFYFILSFLL